MPGEGRVPLALSSADRAAMFVQLARMARTGVPLPEALELIGDIIGGPAQNAAKRGAEALRRGQPLKSAAQSCGLFDEVDVALLAAGDRSGKLPELAEANAERHRHNAALSHELRSSLGYPIFVVTSSFLLMQAPLIFTESFGAFVRAVLLNFAILAAVGIALTLAIRSWQQGRGKAQILAVVARLPVLNRVATARRNTLFFEVMAQSTQAGIGLPEAVTLATAATAEIDHRRTAAEIVAKLSAESLASALAAFTNTSKRTQATVAAGERSGHLPETFTELANDARQQLHAQLKFGLAVMKATLALTIAISIGWQVISQMKAITSDPFALVPGSEGDELRREIDRALPQLRGK